jgi:arylsulfatase A-like enzyme
MSLMTSLEPAVHGLEVEGHLMARSPPSLPSGTRLLAEVLKTAGYQTIAVTAGGGVGRSYGFDRGFDRFHELDPTPREDVEADVDLSLQWLAEADDRPLFFLFHTYEVHQPNTHHVFDGGGDPAQRAVAAYASDLAVADQHIGRLLAGFERLRGLDSAVVVITADHGENLYDRAAGDRPVDHGHHLHAELLRVPLLVVAPGLVPAAGATSGPAMLLDVMPTILSLVALEPASLALQGRDLRGLLQGWAVADSDRELFAAAPLQGPSWSALRTREWALLRTPPVAGTNWWNSVPMPPIALYDRTTDPTERRNIAALHPDVVTAMAQRLDLRRQADLEHRRSLGPPVDVVPIDTTDALRQLGYIRSDDAEDDSTSRSGGSSTPVPTSR